MEEEINNILSLAGEPLKEGEILNPWEITNNIFIIVEENG
jgi:hypothetical protein